MPSLPPPPPHTQPRSDKRKMRIGEEEEDSQPILVSLEPHKRLRHLFSNDGVKIWSHLVALRAFFIPTILTPALALG